MQQHPFRAIFALLALLGFGWISSAQTVYSEDFENETPFDADNLCSPGNEYTPTDGNWALGPACAVTTNGIPKLVDVAGDTYLEYNQKYPADSEVWNSKSINVSAVSDLVVQFDARSVGGLESYGPYWMNLPSTQSWTARSRQHLSSHSAGTLTDRVIPLETTARSSRPVSPNR